MSTKCTERTEVIQRKMGIYLNNYIGAYRHMQIRRRALNSMGWRHIK